MNKVLGGLFLLSAFGVGTELLLLDHHETGWQMVPLILLVSGILIGLVTMLIPQPWNLMLHRYLMWTFIAAGFAGLYFHYRVNVEFELEMISSMSGVALFLKSIKGATPALAPFAMTQIGLLGLISTYPNLMKLPQSLESSN